MAKDGYPSPTAASGNGLGPYPEHPDRPSEVEPSEDDNLRAHLNHEINLASSGPVTQSGPYATSQPEQTYPPQQMSYGFSQGITDSQTTPGPGFQHPIAIAPSPMTPSGEQSARKKPKITRACDECRRKKARYRNVKRLNLAYLDRSAAMPTLRAPGLRNVLIAYVQVHSACLVSRRRSAVLVEGKCIPLNPLCPALPYVHRTTNPSIAISEISRIVLPTLKG